LRTKGHGTVCCSSYVRLPNTCSLRIAAGLTQGLSLQATTHFPPQPPLTMHVAIYTSASPVTMHVAIYTSAYPVTMHVVIYTSASPVIMHVAIYTSASPVTMHVAIYTSASPVCGARCVINYRDNCRCGARLTKASFTHTLGAEQKCVVIFTIWRFLSMDKGPLITHWAWPTYQNQIVYTSFIFPFLDLELCGIVKNGAFWGVTPCGSC
jgi:hypothetical protein